MEQAVNLFNKGLLSDTHPMVQGNNTLSDALNATFVTMNGNEVVLQNDMGNRRVANAFLPSGYEPVGIKEYGGIIYVAAYNPITNRSLIGSFPSPERKIDSLDDKNLQCSFNFFEHFPADKVDENGIKFISMDSVLLPLSDETSLHAGDKFSIYCDDINEENWQKYITNYYNTENRKIKSRKNKELTLSVGILNSLNLFVDITHTLKRWKNNVPLKYDDSYFKDYIFNDGYFISSNKVEDPSNYTLSDAQLIKNRQVIEANTYAYKLVGPLYLKIQLNHIELFNFNIVGDKLTNNTYKLYINATIIYNCNDYSESDRGDEYYKDLGCGTVRFNDWNPFDFYYKKSNEYIKVEGEKVSWSGNNPTYNNGLYTVVVTKEIEISTEDNYVYYFIGVNSGNPIELSYIKSLSTYGTIDVSKLNSGEITLKSFRFFNDNENSTITYTIEAYPKIGQTYKGLSLIFCKNDNEEIEVPENGKLFPLSNGRNTIQINWKETGLEPRTLYKVKFKYHIEGETTPITDSNTRWLLTTKLFNDCYSKVLDFGEKIDSSSDELLRSKLKIELEFEDYNIPTITKLDSITSGKLIDNKDTLKYMISDRYQIEDTLSCKVKIKNYELYPSNLSLNLYELSFNGEQTPINSLYGNSAISFDYSNINFSYNRTSQNDILIKSIDLLNNEDNYIVHRNSGVPQLKYNESNILDIITCNTKGQKIYSLNTTLVCNNIIFASGKNKEVENGFTKVHSEHFRKVLDESTSHSGFFVSNKDRDGDDSHLIGLVLDHDRLSIALKDYTDFEYYHNYNKVEFLDFTNSDDKLNLNFNDEYVKELYDNMSNINFKYTFAYIFSAISTVGRTDDEGEYSNGEFLAYVGDLDAHAWAGSMKNDGSDKNEVISACILGYNPITCCKVWWRDPNGSWVLLNSFSGVFGGNNLPIYSLPEKVDDKFIIVGESNPDNEDFGKKYNSNGETYYNKIYKNLGKINFLEIHGYTYSLFGVNEKVLNQIMNFLDPHDNIVYCLYKNTNLNDLGLKTMDENNCLYTLPYSGNVIMKISFVTNGVYSDLSGLETNNILNFYVDANWKDNVPEHEIAIPILNNNKFEDIVNDTLNTSKISNFYIDEGEILDSNGNRLFPDTIYKIDNNKLKKLENPPYLTYAINNNLNSLVSIDNDFGQSSSSTRYLRAHGDKDAKMSLEFFGGKLRTVNYTRFLDIS